MKEKIGAVFLGLSLLTGCVDTGTTTTTSTALGGAPAADQSACLSAVAAQTGNSATVLSSETSEANNTVMVGVGPMRAPWKCLVKNGTVAEVTSMTNEGTL